MTHAELRKCRGMKTASDALEMIDRIKSESQLIQEGDLVYPNGERLVLADRIRYRKNIIRELIETAQMALKQAEI